MVAVRDYISGVRTLADGSAEPITLPKTKALFYELPGGSNAVVRPSGTEPKIKIYFTSIAPTREEAAAQTERMAADMKQKMGF